jgi:hypothetical protein
MGHTEMILAVAGLDDLAVKERAAKLAGGDWSSFKPSERAGLHLARKLTRTPWEVRQADIDLLTAHLGPEQALETVYYIAGCNHMTRVADAFQLPLEPENVFMVFKNPEPKDEEMAPSIHRPDEIVWRDGPASLPAGAKFALLEGDPSKEGEFVLRLELPDGYRIPAHTHPRAERVTVLSGTFYIGMGEKFDAAKGTAMPAGTYGTWAAGMKHYAWARGKTVIQLHGTGPWKIEYVNPEDDPRRAKK